MCFRTMRFVFSVFLLFFTLSVSAQEGQKKPRLPAQPLAFPSGDWGEFVEKDFPFFSSVLDCRNLGPGMLKDNLTPRGLILNLGHNLWACFDTDLLRMACIWESEPGKSPVSPAALAPGSYHIAGQKTKDGQDFLPKPVGRVKWTTALHAGWVIEDRKPVTDPRSPSASPEEVGRGPLSYALFKAVRLNPKETVLEYEVAQVKVEDKYRVSSSDRELSVVRTMTVMPSDKTIYYAAYPKALRSFTPSDQSQSFTISYTISKEPGKGSAFTRTGSIWSQPITTHAVLSTKPDAYVIDDIPLPVPNPWKRNVRLADITFLNDQGDAAGVTFDGDVWLISGLKGDLENVTWKRFASGLHEPMSIVARKDELFVFDRTGIWKLIDTNKDGTCDRYEMFCNLFSQTAETREFPNSMKLGPDGALYISKGGQQGTTYGKHSGTVIKVAPDGKSFEVIGHGLRQPFIGVHPKTGLVTASDQQGHYVPSTPIHIIEKNQFYGHLPTIAPKEVYAEPIAEPLTWVPHPVNSSGVTQVWLTDAKMGPLNDEMIHIGYNRPELFRVMMNTRFKRPQSAIMSFERDLDFPPLNGHVNPADGQLYIVGFQVWGTTAKKLSGLARLRYTNKPRVLLKEVTPTDKGLLLRFNAKLDEKLATDPASYSAERWNYRRTFEYGSPHLKLDGSTGQEWMTASSAYLSKDGMSVLVGIPDMKTGVHQMRIGWGLRSADGLKAENTAYFSPWDLLTFDAIKEGFGDIQINLTPRAASVVTLAKPTLEEGLRLYQMIGCMACHSTDGSTIGKVGPSWKGLFGTKRELGKGGKSALADEAYIRESITNPSAKVVKGFEKFDTGMPIYAGILNESQIESLVLYIKSLK
jgi:mono/diheme cytochrome c family protein